MVSAGGGAGASICDRASTQPETRTSQLPCASPSSKSRHPELSKASRGSKYPAWLHPRENIRGAESSADYLGVLVSERGADFATPPGQTPHDGHLQACRTAKAAPCPLCLGSSSFSVSLPPLSRMPPSSFSRMHVLWDALLCLKVLNSSLPYR